MSAFIKILICLLSLFFFLSCSSERVIRIQNDSNFDFKNIELNDIKFGDLSANSSSEYKTVKLISNYSALEFYIGRHKITGQALNFGSKRLTYSLTIDDPSQGQLKFEIIEEE